MSTFTKDRNTVRDFLCFSGRVKRLILRFPKHRARLPSYLLNALTLLEYNLALPF